MEGIIIRRMRHEDLEEVQAIENLCFTTPWQVSSFAYEIDNINAILRVAVLGSQIVGHICIRTILDVTHVLDLAVRNEVRRMGIGGMLLNSAMQELKKLQSATEVITLEVRESNIAAIKLYEKFGFNEIGRRRNYYQKPNEDAILMSLELLDEDYLLRKFH